MTLASVTLLSWGAALLLGGCAGTPETSGGAPETLTSDGATESPPSRSPNQTEERAIAAAPEPEAPPPPPPDPEALAERLGSERTVLREAEGEPPVFARVDLTDDGIRDLVLFTVATGSAGPTDGANTLSGFSDISRAVDEPALSGRFGVSIFDPSEEPPRRMAAIEAGRKPVLRDVGVRRLNTAGPLPVAFYFDFADARGQELVWIVHGGGDRVSRLVLRQDALFGTQVKDVDDDGILDVVRSERHLEDGTGYETFITWLKWNGREYVEHRTTNIVRNVNEYVAAAAEALGRADFAAFVATALSADTRARLRQRGVDDVEIVDRILRPASGAGQSFAEFVRGPGDIESAEFPRFFENPFPGPGETVTTPVRVACCGGLSGVFETQLAMSANPFRDPQFYFIPLVDANPDAR